MAFNITRAQNVSHRQIVRFGRTQVNPLALGKLIRDGAARNCTVAILEYKPSEKGLRVDGAMRALVSAKNLNVPPDPEQDELQAGGKIWKIIGPVAGPQPGGTLVFYDLEVTYSRTA